MFKIEGYESVRDVTPVREGKIIKDLVPGRERHYLRLRLRVPFWVIQLLN